MAAIPTIDTGGGALSTGPSSADTGDTSIGVRSGGSAFSLGSINNAVDTKTLIIAGGVVLLALFAISKMK